MNHYVLDISLKNYGYYTDIMYFDNTCLMYNVYFKKNSGRTKI